MSGKPTPTSTPKRRGRRAPTSTQPDTSTGPCRVCIYIRRSTDDEHQPFSLAAQQTALRSTSRASPAGSSSRITRDDASGATTDRPGLKKALARRKPGCSTSYSFTA